MHKAKPTGKYRSKLEKKVSLLLGGEWDYEQHKVAYTMHRTYTPDFSKGDDLFVEVKGFFRPGDQAKYIAIKEALDEVGKELVFIFPNPHKPVRRGAKLTHKVWCDKYGFRCYSTSEVQSEDL